MYKWLGALFLLGISSCSSSPTFSSDIAPILSQNCSGCHNPQGIGPFSLLTYEHARIKAKTIAHVTLTRHMPPWPADKNYTHFVGEKGLSKTEIATIQAWVKANCPEGKKLSKPIWEPSHNTDRKPDMVLKLPTIKLKNDYMDRFYLVNIPGKLSEKKFLQSVHFVPQRPELVHHFNGHLLLYDEGKKKSLPMAQAVEIGEGKFDNDLKRLGMLQDDGSTPLRVHSAVNYLPGVFGVHYPAGIGTIPLTKQFSFVGNDMHYGPSKKNTTDQSELHLFFTNVPPKRQLQELMLGTNGVNNGKIDPPLLLKPNTISTHTSIYVVPEDISILTINPHMHMLGKEFKAYALKPNGDTIRLISIPRWDFRWQYFYTFPTMIKIPKGSSIVATGVYDNTNKNPNNPFSPPQLVGERYDWGGSSMRATDEMFQFIITYTAYQPGDERLELKEK